MASLEDLVVDVVEDAVEWPVRSFAVFGSAAKPSWYVQFAIEDAAQLIVEVANPGHFGGPPYTADQLARIAALGFAAGPENYSRSMHLETPDERDEVGGTIMSVLTDVFGLSGYHDATLDWHRDDDLGANDSAARERLVDAATSLDALMRGEIGDGVRASADPFDSRPLRTWFDGSRGEDPDIRTTLSAALGCQGTAADYLQVLGNAFMAFSAYRRVRADPRWIADAEELAQQILDLGEVARNRGWSLGGYRMGSEIAMFYAREGLMAEAYRARELFGLDEYAREDFEARASAWEKAQ